MHQTFVVGFNQILCHRIFLGLVFCSVLPVLGWSSLACGQEIRLIREVKQETDQSINELLAMDDITKLRSNIYIYMQKDPETKKVNSYKIKEPKETSEYKDLEQAVEQGKLPVDIYAKVNTGPFIDRSFYPKAVLWEAPNICYHPLYFQDVGAERYGQDACLLQPALSGAHFFGRTITLPLHALVRCPFSCDYPLGHYRPGNCNPYLHYSFPW